MVIHLHDKQIVQTYGDYKKQIRIYGYKSTALQWIMKNWISYCLQVYFFLL